MSLDITQDNTVGSVDLLAINSPLVFIVKETHTGTPSDYLDVTIGTDTYRGVFYEDLNSTERLFIFVADEILRSYFDTITDPSQTSGTIEEIGDITGDYTIQFDDEAGDSSASVTIIACLAARDFEDQYGAALVDLYNNDSNFYMAQKGEKFYLYWFNDNAANKVDQTQGVVIGVDAAESSINLRDKLASDYSPYMEVSASGTKDIQVFTGTSPTAVILTAKNGATINFTNIATDPSFSTTLQNNNTTSATLTIEFLGNPSQGDEENVTFRFTSDQTAMPPEGYVEVLEYFGYFGGSTYAKGFIRKALEPTSVGNFTETLVIEGEEFSHNYKVRDFCNSDLLLKFLDNDGQYRFLGLSSYYQKSVSPQKIGDVDRIVTSLQTDKGDKRRIGYNTSVIITGSIDSLSESELLATADLFSSNDVELRIGAKWVQVFVQGDGIIKPGKGKFKDLTVNLELPRSYNITSL